MSAIDFNGHSKEVLLCALTEMVAVAAEAANPGNLG
jgi:hypothetical protein